MSGSITDVGGILVGHHHRIDPDAQLGSGWATGTTVVLTPPGTVGAACSITACSVPAGSDVTVLWNPKLTLPPSAALGGFDAVQK